MKRRIHCVISNCRFLGVAFVLGLASAVGVVAPVHAAAGNILPPFDLGQTWNICEGYGGPTHTGSSYYGLDLTGSGCDNSAAGRNVRAPVGGTVYYYQAEYGNMCINMPDGRSLTLTHINSSITSGTVTAGQWVGTVAAAAPNTVPPHNGNVAHIHLQMWPAHGCYDSGSVGIPFDTAHGARICGAPNLDDTGTGTNGKWSGTAFTGQVCDGTGSDSVQQSYGKVPSVAAANGTMEVFGTNVNGSVETYWQPQPGNSLTGHDVIGSNFVTSPTVIKGPNGELSLFGVDSSGRLVTYWQPQPGNSFTGYAVIANGFSAATPAATLMPNGTVSLFAVDTSNRLWIYWQPQPGNSFIGNAVIANNIKSGTPAVALNGNGTLNVFAVDTSNQLWTYWQPQPGNSFTGNAVIAGSIASSPTVVTGANGAMSVFVVDMSNQLWIYWQPQPGNSFTGNAVVAGQISKNIPAATVSSSGILSVYAVDTSGQLWTYWQPQPGSSLTGNAVIASNIWSGTPSVVTASNGALSVFAVDTSNRLWIYWQPQPGNSFTGNAVIGSGWR